MWVQDYLDIQMLQSRLTIYTDSIQAYRIGEELFADCSDVEIDIQEVNIPLVKINGYESVKDYYRQLDHIIRDNGDTLGSNLSTCQNIQISTDGCGASGCWYTYKVDILGKVYGYGKGPFPYILSIGKYENKFIKTEDGWRFKKISWVPIWNLDTYQCGTEEGEVLRQNTCDWPMPYKMYDHMKVESDADTGDIRFCETVLKIRNLAGSFADRWNHGNYNKILSLFENSRDVSFFKQGMPSKLKGYDNITQIFNCYEKYKQAMGGYAGIVLTTTGVIQPDTDGKTAHATWTLFCLDPKSVQEDKVTFANHTSRWNIVFAENDGDWKIRSMEWVEFATMSDLHGRRADA